jgi:hypothetical protein
MSESEDTESQSQAELRTRHIQKLIALSVLIIILAIAGLVTSLSSNNKASGYQTVEQNFISYIQNKDQPKADALESPNFKTLLKKSLATTSFEQYCDTADNPCYEIFSNAFISNAAKNTTSYTSSNHLKGESMTYTYDGYKVGGTKCSVNVKLGIALVPKGKTWQVDNVGLSLKDFDSACSTS